MTVVNARTWIEHLSTQDCWQLLAEAEVGRIAVLVEGQPVIFPVNFGVDARTIVFRTDPGNKLRGLSDHASVSFEVDQVDLDTHRGWSVLVKGRAGEITDAEQTRALDQLPLEFWTIGPKSHWVRIAPSEVTGRRIHPVVSLG
jgi:nitroimidazol reductase NimA-like FMN-containing flavoprotein (pyridoxamine 5'-phosphate oxidase superfamily)